MSHEEMHCLGIYFVCKFPDSGYVSQCNMASKTSRTTNFSEQGKLSSAELDFPEMESKGYNSKMLAKKAKAWEDILTKFNSQNPKGMNRDLRKFQGCWRRHQTPVEKGA